MQKTLLLVDSSWHCGGDCDDSDDSGGDDGNDGDDGGDSGGDGGDSDDGCGLHFIGDQANPKRGGKKVGSRVADLHSLAI